MNCHQFVRWFLTATTFSRIWFDCGWFISDNWIFSSGNYWLTYVKKKILRIYYCSRWREWKRLQLVAINIFKLGCPVDALCRIHQYGPAWSIVSYLICKWYVILFIFVQVNFKGGALSWEFKPLIYTIKFPILIISFSKLPISELLDCIITG